MKTKHIFVYGSLRRDLPERLLPPGGAEAIHAMRRLARYRGKARLSGQLIHLGDYPGLVDSTNTEVIGDLYRSDDMPRLLAALDAYEESTSAQTRRRSDAEYFRTRRKVRTENGEEVYAWVYVCNRECAGAVPILSGDYLDWIESQTGTVA